MNQFKIKVEKPSEDCYSDIESDYVAEIWDDSEIYLPDFTPDWLYDILEDVKKSSGGVCDELMESIFEIDETFYNAIIKHPQCAGYEEKAQTEIEEF